MYKTGFHVCHQRAVAVNFVENDLFIFTVKKIDGDRWEIDNLRLQRGGFYKTDMSGKCDCCIESKTALTKLIGNPVLWNGESQITGFNASNR
jgi:hypothetical protein